MRHAEQYVPVWAGQLRLTGEVKGLLLVTRGFEVPALRLSVPASESLNMLLYVSDALCRKTATGLSSGSFLSAVPTTASFFAAGSARALLSSAVSLTPVCAAAALHCYSQGHSCLAAASSAASAHLTSRAILTV